MEPQTESPHPRAKLRATTTMFVPRENDIRFVDSLEEGLKCVHTMTFRSSDGSAPTREQCLAAIPEVYHPLACAVRNPSTVIPRQSGEMSIYLVDVYKLREPTTIS